MTKKGKETVKEEKKIAKEEKLIRDVALDLLKVPHVFRLSVKKRFKSTVCKTSKEWTSVYKKLGMIK